jgi:DNA-binding NarL/FixJ family response regulator
MLSMHVSREYIYLALQAGARGYLVKDSAGRDVIEAVRAVHAGKRYLSPQITDELVGDFLLDEGRSVGPLGSLSEREREILELVVEGRSSAQIGTTLHLSPKTIETYRSRLMQKLGVGDITGLVKFAVKHGLTSLE